MRLVSQQRCDLFSPLLLAALGLVVALPAARLQADTEASSRAADKAAAALYEGIRTETLPNGLRVFLKPVPSSPVVTTMLAYKVGSADEDLDNTGLSHYLEHLMFKGTEKIMPGDIDRLTLRNGGANNANTSEDCTVYHFDFAADRWEAALEVEADRMRNLCIDPKHEFEQEKGAVIEELEKDEDEPWDLEEKTILPLLFGEAGPYGHPVIGQRQHVRGATAKVIKAHYDKWYYPNNAVLVVCGGFDPDKTMAKIKQLFGPLPQGTLPERKKAPEVKRDGPVQKDFDSKFNVARMLMGFNTVRTGDPDFYPLQVIQAILSEGKTSRLYKKLVEGEEIAGQIGSSNSGGRYPGWFSVQVELLKVKDRAKAENIVLEELKRLREEPVSEAELKRVKRGLLVGTVFKREGVHGLADSIARGVTIADLDYIKTYLPRIAAVTAEDVKRAARKYFDPQQRVVVWSIPKVGAGGAGARGNGDGGQKGPATGRARGRVNAPAKGDAGVKGVSLKDARRVVLDNGLTLLLLEDHRLPILVADAFVRQVRLHEPADKVGVAALTGRLLEEGTKRHTGPEIAELIENTGGSLDLSSSGGSLRVLSPDRGLGLSLLVECLSQPTFPKEAFARERERLLSDIDDAERQPETKAQMVYKELAYGQHPYSRPALGRHKAVEALKPEDCAAFHRQVFVPNNTILVVVGDFDSKQLIEELTRLTADWKRAPLPEAKAAAIEKPEQFTEKIVTLPQAAQLHFLMGHVGVRRDNPDYYKLLVMDYILGTGPGFTDRLSARLRDRQGLAYTVNARITESASEEPGLFTCYIGTRPGNFERVKGTFLEELARIREEKPTLEEVEDAKKYLLGSLPFELTTNQLVAAHLVAAERYHLGLGYLDDYRKAVAAVTPADVQEVARKYLDPRRMVLVAVGAIDAKGKALEAAPLPRKR
jgi:zinc protease